MPVLKRSGARLLRTVNGKPHASSNDHEEEQGPATPVDDIYADPISSGDEDSIRPVQPKNSSRPIPNATKSSKAAKPASSAPPRPNRNQRQNKIIPPRKLALESSRADKNRLGRGSGANQDADTSSQSSASKRKIEDEENGNIFGEMDVPKRQRVQKSFTSNLHAPRPNAVKTYGAKRTYGSGASRGISSTDNKKLDAMEDLIDASKGKKKSLKQKIGLDDPDNDSEFSTISDDEPAPAPSRKSKFGAKNKTEEKPPPPKRARANLMDTIGMSRNESAPSSSAASAADKGSAYQALGRSLSSPLSSVRSGDIESSRPTPGEPGESLQTLEQYFADLPSGASDDKCPLCEAEVEQEHHWEFWKGKPMNVRNQTLFCREHKHREAEAEYKKKGYPLVDWAVLPDRIKTHHSTILSILRDEEQSDFRDRYAEKVALGENRSVRTRIKKDVQIKSLTGYYGSRGMRTMTEALSTQLDAQLKDRNQVDRVVSFAGVITFVMSVLVPELTICLVMDDLECSRLAAIDCIDESADLGLVVHEEIEDEVHAGEEEEVRDSDDDMDDDIDVEDD